MKSFFLSCERLVLIEPEAKYFETLTSLSSIHLNMEIFKLDLKGYYSEASKAKNFDSVVCINALEHIEDDA